MKPYLSEPQSTLVPAVAAVAVDISAADAEFDSPCRALWVGGSGNVDVRMMNGEIVTFTNVEGLLPIRADIVYDTSTASNMLALY